MRIPLLDWLRRPFDRCRADGRRIFTKHGYDLCRKHGGMPSPVGSCRLPLLAAKNTRNHEPQA